MTKPAKYGRHGPEILEEILEALRDGRSMRAICEDKRMPDRATVRMWCEGDDSIATAITRAREIGFIERGEKAVEEAKAATDAPLGRLAFDAERWYLGKLSNAFRDKSSVEVTGKDGGAIQLEQVQRDADAFKSSITSLAARSGKAIPFSGA